MLSIKSKISKIDTKKFKNFLIAFMLLGSLNLMLLFLTSLILTIVGVMKSDYFNSIYLLTFITCFCLILVLLVGIFVIFPGLETREFEQVRNELRNQKLKRIKKEKVILTGLVNKDVMIRVTYSDENNKIMINLVRIDDKGKEQEILNTLEVDDTDKFLDAINID